MPKAAAPQAVSAAPAMAAAPKSGPVPVAAKAAVVAKPGGELELPPDELVGTAIGNYQIEARIGDGSMGPIYRATQTNMGRQVRLYTLDRTRAQDAEEIQRFIANASVKANVSHPYIFAVYEAGEKDGIYFYSCEYVPCRSLTQLRLSGNFLDEKTALQTMKVASEVLAYFARENIVHELISENAILIGPSNRPRIANTAAYQSAQEFDATTEMRQLGAIVASSLPENSTALGVRALAMALSVGHVYPDWPTLNLAVAALEPKVAPEDAYKLDAQERAAIRMVDEAKKQQKKNMMVNTIVSLGLLAVALFCAWFFLLRPKGATVTNFDKMLEIPAGEFIYQEGEKASLPKFYIDEYEVTIGQYAEFLQYLKDHPDEAAKFDHPKQPKNKSHVPKDWADQQLATDIMYGYYARAKRWGSYQNAALDVNSPVFNVDWFDAYAYANWKGRRLPTEQEWEKAARGTKGFKYPWGNEANPKNVSSGTDWNPDPKKGGDIDGYKRWSPVNAVKGDRSPFDVMDMAGNVAEWTSTYDVNPDEPSMKNPVIRGGSWQTATPLMTRRVMQVMDLQQLPTLGFRTASDNPPPAAKK